MRQRFRAWLSGGLLRPLTLCALGGLLALATGCATETSTIVSSGYWKRHFQRLGHDTANTFRSIERLAIPGGIGGIPDEFHQMRIEIDRVVFDLEDHPIEDM